MQSNGEPTNSPTTDPVGILDEVMNDLMNQSNNAEGAEKAAIDLEIAVIASKIADLA